MPRLPFLDTLARDAKYALRMLRRTPAFTAAAVATLALVIGGNTAVASLADALLLRALPFPHPDRLAVVVTQARGDGGSLSMNDSQDGTSWETLRDDAKSVDVAMYAGGFGGGVNMVVNENAVAVAQSRVSAGYFRVLGVAPFVGREFTRDEDRPGGPAVAIVSYELWQGHLRGDPAIVGRTMLLRGEPYTVVGVMPEGFRSPGGGTDDVWTPARPSRTGEGGGTNYGVIARVRDGRTWTQAAAELETLGRTSFTARGRIRAGRDAWWALVPMQEAFAADARQPIELLAAAMAMVLVIACVNIAALLVARSRTRAKEMATRMALGSGRAGVVRQLLVESLVLALVGGLAGVFVGRLALDGLKALGGTSFWATSHAVLDARALAWTAGLSLLTSVLFGLAPAVQASRVDVNAALTTEGSRSIAGGARHWTRRALVVIQVALGLVLLVVTGLLIRTFVNLRTMDPGFDAASVTTATVSLQDARYQTSSRANQLFDRSIEDLERTPGVEAAAVSLELPYRRLLNMPFRFADAGDANAGLINLMYVTPHFFDTLKIPLRRGRAFAAADRADAPLVAIVNETFVRSWGKGADPIARRLRIEADDREIVGVVGDVLVTNAGIGFPGATPGPLMTSPLVFIPAAQTSDSFLRLVHTWFQPKRTVRANGAVNVAKALPQAITGTDPLLPVMDVQSLSAVQAAATSRQRLLMTLVGVVAAAALLLSVIGIYGLIAQGVAERTREFGIRLALGATVPGTIWDLVRSGLLVSGSGVAIGTALAWMAVSLFDSFAVLFHVDKHDPLTFVLVATAFIVVASIASVLPALRILRLEPAKVLRG